MRTIVLINKNIKPIRAAQSAFHNFYKSNLPAMLASNLLEFENVEV